MTREIASAVWEAINPAGVGVVIEACHMCMVSSNDRHNIIGYCRLILYSTLQYFLT